MDKFCAAISTQNYAGVGSLKKLWKPGSTLRVFCDCSPTFGEEIVRIANTWAQFGNIKFSLYEQRRCEIRVGFNRADGSWSHIGTDALEIRERENTMNLGWLYEGMADREELRRVVLHEFGHALGLEHEHSSPMLGVDWNRPVVYDYYRNSQGWRQNDVDFNIFRKLEIADVMATPFDDRSIMLYSFPPEFTTNNVGFPWSNSQLSDGDRQLIAKLYPF